MDRRTSPHIRVARECSALGVRVPQCGDFFYWGGANLQGKVVSAPPDRVCTSQAEQESIFCGNWESGRQLFYWGGGGGRKVHPGENPADMTMTMTTPMSRLPDTSAVRHFGSKTLRRHCRSVSKTHRQCCRNVRTLR